MKILYCYRYGILGGVSTQLRNRLLHIRIISGIEVHILFDTDLGIGDHFEGLATVHYSLAVEDLRHWVEGMKFQVVVVIDTPEYFEALADTRNRGFHLIAEVHTSIPKNLEYLGNRGWTVDAFIVPSQYMRKLLIEEYNVPHNPGPFVVSNSLDVERFKPAPPESPPPVPIIGWVGKIDDHKNWRAYVHVCRILAEDGFDFEMWLCGGETCPRDLGMEVVSTVDACGLIARFRWFDRISNQAMPRFYTCIAASGGCKLVTSHNESFGMSVLEALCCECPVVSSEVGALPELGDGKSYVSFYPLGDLQSAADAIRRMFDREAAPLARQALAIDRKVLAARFSPQTVGRDYVRLLQLFIANSSREKQRIGGDEHAEK